MVVRKAGNHIISKSCVNNLPYCPQKIISAPETIFFIVVFEIFNIHKNKAHSGNISFSIRHDFNHIVLKAFKVRKLCQIINKRFIFKISRHFFKIFILFCFKPSLMMGINSAHQKDNPEGKGINLNAE